MTAPPKCPVCLGELVVGAPTHRDEGTRYYWCPFCDVPRDPAEPEGLTSGAAQA